MAQIGRPRQRPIDRFTRQVRVVASGCHEWAGTIDKYGYGQFGTGGRTGQKVGAHRWAYRHYKGPIPEGFQIDHLCRNRKCVNPEHMEAVTPRENVMRSSNPASVNARRTHCVNGHPLFGDNIYPNTSRQRVCKICKKATSDRNYRKRQEAIRNGYI